MNDVLPKPFTKEGLLNMLEKHLGHMKKSHSGVEAMGPPGLNNKASMKSEESPATSPATVTNWASPGGVVGASPATNTSDEFGNPIAASPAYAMAGSMNPGPSPQAMTLATSPTAPPNMRQQVQQAQAQQAHKRQISEISGGHELSADMRRPPPMFMPVPGGPPPPPQMMAQPPMGVHMQPPGPMPPRR